ncbi:MAG TPA: glycosyl hydrolase [Cytophagales bacterium]|nr:glycosyl hydrolase [Cytophagales bacterium]
MFLRTTLLGLALLVLGTATTEAQRRRNNNTPPPAPAFDEEAVDALSWRNVGPHRGGRSTAASGFPDNPYEYLMGSTGGGVWRTTNAGETWTNISDGFFNTGSVGAIAISSADPNVIYVGMGEAPVRGVMTSHGDGVYKSTDRGRTWTHVGLEGVRQISKIRIHPTNPDIAWVGGQGSPYGLTDQRGVYKTTDGGTNWRKVLYVNDKAGVSDLSLDATNPRILYAAFWEHQRLPWKVVSGGEGSGIWKSEDGGETWNELTEGLPDLMGKIGVTAAPAQSGRVWAIVEAEKGGLYKSDDYGETWSRVNGDRVLQARSWYYMHVFAHPTEANTVFVLNAPVLRSTDGGRTFQGVPTPHGDNHDLWINPEHPNWMINANDGGANITYNNGMTWSRQSSQPTAQFYRINADNQFPYRIYGGQQDNSSVSIPNRTFSGGISNDDFYAVGGCESAWPAFDRDNPRYVYAGCYQGIISEWDEETRTQRDVMAYYFLGLGENAADLKYRFNWNAPILVSVHDPSVIYHAGNHVLKSTNRGDAWAEVSPDLTKNDTSHIGYGGGPITSEGAGGEVYHTIASMAESTLDAQELWVGADDGLVHVTLDGGANWTNVTPPALNGQDALINSIEVSPTTAGTAYLAVTRYKFNDFTPHIFKTTDHGKTWQRLVNGIPPEAHVRVVREDPDRKGLLYAGTETGLYISWNGGMNWHPFQLNLPVVPITDLMVHQGDLLASTQGRAFWVLDDLTVLHQWDEAMANAEVTTFQPNNPYRVGGGRNDESLTQGTNPDNGLVFYYNLSEGAAEADSVALLVEVLDENGTEVLRTFSADADEAANLLTREAGMHKLVWNFRGDDYDTPRTFLWQGQQGPLVTPGKYQVRLTYGEEVVNEYGFEVMADPRLDIPMRAYQDQANLIGEIQGTLEEVYAAVMDLRSVREQLKQFNERLGADTTQAELSDHADSLVQYLNELEGVLVQNKQETFQDVINFPNQLNIHLMDLQNTLDGAVPPVTGGQRQRWADLQSEWADYQEQLTVFWEEMLPNFNQEMQKATVPYIAPAPRD